MINRAPAVAVEERVGRHRCNINSDTYSTGPAGWVKGAQGVGMGIRKDCGSKNM